MYNFFQIAFIGKSNVGKSSLLAALFTQIPKLKVRVSSKPVSDFNSFLFLKKRLDNKINKLFQLGRCCLI